MNDLDLMDIFGPDNENILSGHGEPALNLALKADEIVFDLADGFCQHIHIGDTDHFLTGQQHMDIAVLQMAFPDGFFFGHGLVDALAGAAANIQTLNTLVDEPLGQSLGALDGNSAVVVIAGVQSGDNAFVLLNVPENAPRYLNCVCCYTLNLKQAFSTSVLFS